ncbi:MAG: hypothetical protein K9J37_07710 [Saprospiraceae bacterium]|nr:hypothetical protein [Saprospiraceae bacterium]MCF8249783.1 hypothetical protein [Saprospiraceae bacterium]MCF8279268.1 hypothetical protein [Bacteroidales bacterium]MCF8312816.1 hypothetical protein [Saprospiraceae bacterium]MCF8441263.1 hypothetical protein [Saprospiraceae bacterium]
MKKTTVLFLLFSTFLGCIKDDIKTTISNGSPSKIDGLELTYLSTNLQGNFINIYFINESTGYIAGYDGALYKTVDRGMSWTELSSNTTLPLYDFYFLNEQEGFVVGGDSGCNIGGCVPEGAIILHTLDAGQTWNKIDVSTAEPIELNSIYFVNDMVGYAVGRNSVLSTIDGGLTWLETVVNDLEGEMWDIEFINEEQGLIACTAGNILKTIDGGENWEISSPFPQVGAYTLSLVNKDLVFTAGYTQIGKSSNFGDSWSNLPNAPLDIFTLKFKSENVGYALGRGEYSGGDLGRSLGAIYFTKNGGNTWEGNSKINEVGPIRSASFPSENLGFAISGNMIVKIFKP